MNQVLMFKNYQPLEPIIDDGSKPSDIIVSIAIRGVRVTVTMDIIQADGVTHKVRSYSITPTVLLFPSKVASKILHEAKANLLQWYKPRGVHSVKLHSVN